MPGSSQRLTDAAVFAAPAVFVILWASGFIGAKYGLPYAEPMTFLAVRMAAVVAMLAIIVALTRPVWPGAAGVGHSALTGVLVHGGYLGGVFVSIDQGLPAGLTALIVGLQPVLASTIANRLLGETVTPRQWAGLLLGVVGVGLVVEGRTHGDTEAGVIGWIAALVALLGITTGTLYQKRFGGGIDWRAGLFVQYAAAGLLFALAALAFEDRSVRWTAEFLFAVGWLAVVLSLGAVWLLYFLIRRSAAARLASLFYLTPPTTALMAWALFGERLGPLALCGMAVCVVGVALVNWRAGAPAR
jgi:drug/metabolite transporter (DMT)-like permease